MQLVLAYVSLTPLLQLVGEIVGFVAITALMNCLYSSNNELDLHQILCLLSVAIHQIMSPFCIKYCAYELLLFIK
mgnify:CR=1 FL=1